MKSKKPIILIVILIIFVIAAGSFALNKKFLPSIWLVSPQEKISIQDQQITDNTRPFKINVIYPQIAGQDDFNQKAKAIVDKEISQFKNNSLENDKAVKDTDPVNYAKYPREYELDISYTKGEVDENIISTIFNVYNFEGGAHGASYFVPLNYNVKTKTEIKLADMFPNNPNYLQMISDFCISDLTKQLTEKLGSLEGTSLQDGAGPKEENFQFFLINNDSIVFYFPQYQVAFYAAGDFQVTMPR